MKCKCVNLYQTYQPPRDQVPKYPKFTIKRLYMYHDNCFELLNSYEMHVLIETTKRFTRAISMTHNTFNGESSNNADWLVMLTIKGPGNLP